MGSEKQYIRIYDEVREDIIQGRYSFGEKLPSKRVMAENMGVSVITVEHAYELLSEEGYIVSREKSGYFVAYEERDIYVAASVRHLHRFERKTEIPASTDRKNPVDFSFSAYSKAVRRVLSEYGEFIMKKSPKKGLYQLRIALSEYLGRSRRMQVDPEQIYVGAGAEYLYGLIVQTFGRDIVYGVESPSYQKIAKVYAVGGATLNMLSLKSDGIDSDELWKGDMKLLHITPYRSFPSGISSTAAKKREYLKWSRKKDGYIIEDDFESEFTPSRKPEETLFSIDDEGRVIYINTFTRTIGSYTRAAYMVIPESLMPLFDEKVGFYECPVPTLDQLVIAQLIQNGDFERHINKVRRKNRNKN